VDSTIAQLRKEINWFMVLEKNGLLPHLDYDREAAVQNILKVNPQMPILETSAKTEEGFDSWIEWLMQKLHG
jgi:hydrogenase nickel incorporation protein HypB